LSVAKGRFRLVKLLKALLSVDVSDKIPVQVAEPPIYAFPTLKYGHKVNRVPSCPEELIRWRVPYFCTKYLCVVLVALVVLVLVVLYSRGISLYFTSYVPYRFLSHKQKTTTVL
jgi:hypothetical protein